MAAFDGGVSYALIETMELADVRLVYAAPRAIGEYGGEIDNWMWPRHTGEKTTFSGARMRVVNRDAGKAWEIAREPGDAV